MNGHEQHDELGYDLNFITFMHKYFRFETEWRIGEANAVISHIHY